MAWLAFAWLASTALGAETLSGKVLWQSVTTDLVQSGPEPGRIHFKPAEGRQFVLVAAEIQVAGPRPENGVAPISGERVRLGSGAESFAVSGSFEDSGYIVWFVPSYSVVPGGKTRVRAIFETPVDRTFDRLEFGDNLRLPLVPEGPWPGASKRLDVEIAEVRSLTTPLAIRAVAGPASSIEAWPGGRLIVVDASLRLKEGEADEPFALTTEDFYLQSTGRIYRCAGRLAAEGERLEPGPAAVLLPGVLEPGSTPHRLRLVFCIDARETKLWLSLGDRTVAFDVPRAS